MSIDPLYRWNRKPTGPCLEKHAYMEHNKGITDNEYFLMIDWAQIILNISARNKWQIATVARKINGNAEHLRKIVRGQVKEPKYSTALKLLDLYND